MLLAREAEAVRLKISPKRVSTCGEQMQRPGTDGCRRRLGNRDLRLLGVSEGVYAFPCEAGAAMHLPDDLAIIEPVDRYGNVVAPGQTSGQGPPDQISQSDPAAHSL